MSDNAKTKTPSPACDGCKCCQGRLAAREEAYQEGYDAGYRAAKRNPRRAPFGFCNEDGLLVVVPGQRATALALAEMRADGETLGGLVLAANRQNLDGANSGQWTISKVRTALRAAKRFKEAEEAEEQSR